MIKKTTTRRRRDDDKEGKEQSCFGTVVVLKDSFGFLRLTHDYYDPEEDICDDDDVVVVDDDDVDDDDDHHHQSVYRLYARKRNCFSTSPSTLKTQSYNKKKEKKKRIDRYWPEIW